MIDRRAFTSDGDLRTSDAIPHEPATPPAGTPTAPGAPVNPPPAEAESGPAPIASAQFQHLLLNLASQAAAHLGTAKDPLTGQIDVDIDAAHQIIDLLSALRQKTLGNLTTEENDLLDGLIGDLQLQYVTARSKAPKTS